MCVGVVRDCREIAASTPCYFSFMPSLFFLLPLLTILNNVWFGDDSISKELWIIPIWGEIFQWLFIITCSVITKLQKKQNTVRIYLHTLLNNLVLLFVRCWNNEVYIRLWRDEPNPFAQSFTMTPSHLNMCSWLALRRSQHAVLHHSLANSASVGGRNPFLVSFGKIWVLFECILY